MGSDRASLRRLLLPAPACLAALLLVAGCSLHSRPPAPVATPRPFAAVTPSASPVQSITEPQMPQAPSEAEPAFSEPPLEPPAQVAEGNGSNESAPAPAEEAPAPDPGTVPDAVPEPEPVPAPEAEPEPQAYYANCTEAHEAGVTPLYRGDSGYGTHLDRDEDGIACEKK